jgi:hypothetical protein
MTSGESSIASESALSVRLIPLLGHNQDERRLAWTKLQLIVVAQSCVDTGVVTVNGRWLSISPAPHRE